MAFPLLIGLALAGLALQGIGTAVQMAGQAQASEASKRNEALREKQMNLEASRQRRQTLRNALKARSMALVAGADSGASFGSGLAGGLGSIQSTAASNIQGINQGTEIGSGIFENNKTITGAQELTSFGSGLSSLGNALFSAAPTMGQIGKQLG